MFNNGFPMGYQQVYQQYQQPQGKMVEVVPVDSVDAAAAYPVAIGSTQVMFARDDSFIAVKSAGVNGASSLDIYDKRPPAPPEPRFDPSAYVTRDELESRLAALKEVKE